MEPQNAKINKNMTVEVWSNRVVVVIFEKERIEYYGRLPKPKRDDKGRFLPAHNKGEKK